VPTQRTALVILGMHRSGTSSLAGLLSRLGCSLGDDLLEANEWNPLGYGEHREIVARHDALLRAAGAAWDSARMPDPGAAELRAAEADFASLLERDFGATMLFAVKDPRMCRLLRLWRTVFEAARIDARYVIMQRHPLEISASLGRRDGFALSRSLLLWATHVLPAERETRHARRAFVSYADLMRNWRGVAERLADDLGVAWPIEPDSAAREIEGYLSGELRHHTAPTWPAEDAQRFPWAVALQEALARLAENDGTETRAAVDSVARNWACAAALYEPELAAADAAASAARDAAAEAERARRKAERKVVQLADAPTLWLRTFLRRRLRGGKP
jgi:hypothetical protein